MTRRSRNLLLALVLALAGLWLAFELAARAQARALAGLLAPTAALSYAGAGFAWDGGVRLDAPQLQITRGLWQGTVRAREARVYGPGFWWLLLARMRESEILPSQARIELDGLAPTDAGRGDFVSRQLQPGGIVLFESAGCGDVALGEADRQRMGVAESERRDIIDLRHDSANQALDLVHDASRPGLASTHVQLQLASYSPAAWHDGREREKLRVTRAEFRYTDSGYLAQRTRHCAQRLDLPSTQFIDRHLAAVDQMLGAEGITAAAEVRNLYRALVTDGGTFSLTAIPDATWNPERIDADSRGETLRRLNVTARHDDDPPVMLRLSFTDVEDEPELPVAMVDGVDAEALAETSGPPAESTATQGATAIADIAQPLPAIIAPAQAREEAQAQTAIDAEPIAAIEEPGAEVAPGTRLEAAFDPRNPGRALGASAPEPPKDSTLALVWRPGVIDRLQTDDPQTVDYEVVAASALGQYAGRRVRLLTTGGKLIEGRINGVAGGRVVLDIRVGGGSAQVPVALANVREARLLRSSR